MLTNYPCVLLAIDNENAARLASLLELIVLVLETGKSQAHLGPWFNDILKHPSSLPSPEAGCPRGHKT